MKKINIEFGRSMVETLGVLVIVGILSVGSMAGYTYAMAKYRANNIVNEMNVVSHSLSMQLNTDGKVLMLGTPYDEGHIKSEKYAFSYGCGNMMEAAKNCTTSEKGYWFFLNDVPQNVCNHILTMSNGILFLSEQKVNDEVVSDILTCSKEKNSMLFMFQVGATKNKADTEEEEKPNVNCPANTSRTGLGGLAVVFTDEATGSKANCYCNEMNTKYTNAGICEEQPETCTSNSDCNRGYYCEIIQYKTENNNTYATHDTSNMLGECHEISADLMDKPEEAPFWLSNRTMNWWSVKYFCEALEKSMIEVSDLGCSNTICASGCSATSGYCRVSAEASTSEKTEIVENMYTLYGNITDKAWINLDYDLRYPYYVAFDRNRIDFMGRTGKNRAVCK